MSFIVHLIKICLLMSIFTIFVSCSLIPNKKLEGNIYDIGADITHKKALNTKKIVLALEPTKIRSVLKTDYIIVRQENGRLSSYPFRLSEGIGQLMNYRLKDALVKAQIAQTIVSTTDSLFFDAYLKSKITNFQILRYEDKNSETSKTAVSKKGIYYFVFSMDVILANTYDRKYIETKKIHVKYRLSHLNDEEILKAMRLAVTDVFSSIIQWIDDLSLDVYKTKK